MNGLILYKMIMIDFLLLILKHDRGPHLFNIFDISFVVNFWHNPTFFET